MMSHLCSPEGSRSFLDRLIATSAMSQYLKLDGHVGTVAIHSLKEAHQSARRNLVCKCSCERMLTSPQGR